MNVYVVVMSRLPSLDIVWGRRRLKLVNLENKRSFNYDVHSHRGHPDEL